MLIIKEEHAKKWKEAIIYAGAVGADGTVDADFGASLYIITGIPSLYERVKRHIRGGYIDFDKILNAGLSSGERTLVALAGNLYNGGFSELCSPHKIVSSCDKNMVELAAGAILLRSDRIELKLYSSLRLNEPRKEDDDICMKPLGSIHQQGNTNRKL